MAVAWGIVGLGSIASRVAQAITTVEGSTLGAVCSRDPRKAAAFAQRFGAARSYSAYGDMLADAAVDAVYIATPNSLHAPQTILALEAGKHVLVEKPMALTVADAQRMVEVARHRARHLAVGFHLRKHPVHQEMRRSLAVGEVGEAVFAQALWGSYASDFWQSGRDRWQMNPSLAGAGSIMGRAAWSAWCLK
jgi:predicted dehydrogenase